MNYNKLSFDLFVENDLSSTRILSFYYKDLHTLPVLGVSTRGQDLVFTGTKDILRLLRERKHLQKGIDYSVWETQGLEFVNSKVEPAVLAYTAGLKDKFHTAFMNTMMREPQSTGEALSSLKQVIIDATRTYSRDKHTKIYSSKEAKTHFIESLDEFQSRMSGNFYYGGETPNAVDFRVIYR